jgi:putative sterol carrier protein
MPADMRVRLHERERMSLLGLALGASLERALAAAGGADLPRGAVAIEAGTMAVTIAFRGDEIVVRDGEDVPHEAAVRGELTPLLELCAGRLPLAAFLRGAVRTSGKLGLVLRLARLLAAAQGAPVSA